VRGRIVIIGSATVANTVLVFMLSARLRRRELLPLFKIGGTRVTVASLLLAEVVVVILASIAFAIVLTAMTGWFGANLIRG
jgi:putative ABC transport system permease protein